MSHYKGSSSADCKVYVGDLGSSASKEELERAFSYYGKLQNVWVARHPPGFAFVEFEDPRDAKDSVKGLDGRMVCGRRVRVEMSRTSNGRGPYGGRSQIRGRPFNPEDRCYDCGERGHYARDCHRDRRGRSDRGRSYSRSRSPDRRRRSRTVSRSRSRDRRSRSTSARRNSRDNSHHGSPRNRSYDRSRSRSRS